jgi:hypothetical protein
MKCNVGKADKVVRYVICGAIVIAGIAFNSWWGAVGLIPIVTDMIGWCPLYVPFGIKTSPKE